MGNERITGEQFWHSIQLLVPRELVPWHALSVAAQIAVDGTLKDLDIAFEAADHRISDLEEDLSVARERLREAEDRCDEIEAKAKRRWDRINKAVSDHVRDEHGGCVNAQEQRLREAMLTAPLEDEPLTEDDLDALKKFRDMLRRAGVVK